MKFVFISFLFSISYFFSIVSVENKRPNDDEGISRKEVLPNHSGSKSLLTNLYINEFLASNDNVDIPGHDGKDDWIEIYNDGTSPVDISGFYITDNLSTPQKVRLPTSPGSLIVPPKGYLLLICSDNPALGSNHIELGLSASGEAIGFFAPDGTTQIDTYTFGTQRGDVSMGRNPLNLSEWKYFSEPTPGAANNVSQMYDELIPAPVFSHEAGFYNASFALSLESTVSGTTIYYTLDGSEPDMANIEGKTFRYKTEVDAPLQRDTMFSYVYGAPIYISDRSVDPNKLSFKNSSAISGSESFKPNEPVLKGTVVKAIAFKPNSLSEVAVNTYFVFDNTDRFTMPVVSVSLDENKMFDHDTGFYTVGANYAPAGCPQGNYNMGWRHKGYFEYFVKNERVVDRALEYRIHGGCSRSFPRKSLRVLGGSKFEYPIFPRIPERLHRNIILRNSGNNWNTSLMKDAANHVIVDGLHIGKQEAVPSVVFINGEYWGIHNIRERLDNHYLENVYGVSKDSVDMIEVSFGFEAQEGDMNKFNDLQSFILNNNVALDVNYDSLAKLVDIESLIDFNAAHIYFGNLDWPHNNVRMWRKRVDNFNPAIKGVNDGRWRYILFDTDQSVEYDHNLLAEVLAPDAPHKQYNFVFRNAILNNKFRKAFITRFTDLINSNFKTNHTIPIIEHFRDVYLPEMVEHIKRWNVPTFTQWQDRVQSLIDYNLERPGSQRAHIRSYFGLGSGEDLNVSVLDTLQGYVTVNTIDILPTTPGVSNSVYPWSGRYFADQEVTITGKGRKGYKFKHWLLNGNHHSDSATLVFYPRTINTYTAVFEESLYSSNLFPVAKVLDVCGYDFKEWVSSSPGGTYPNNMAFVLLDRVNRGAGEPGLSDTIRTYTTGSYSRSSGTRINGLAEDGISFINTGSGNDDYPSDDTGKLGGAILAINTEGVDSVFVSWLGGTIVPNFRNYAIRLQYRVGDIVDFKDLLDGNGSAIEYNRNTLAGHYQMFSGISLPTDALGKPYVQLFWRYYDKGGVESGARPQLRLDDISVITKAKYSKGTRQEGLSLVYGEIQSGATIEAGDATYYEASRSILLEEGFETSKDAIFKAVIVNCD